MCRVDDNQSIQSRSVGPLAGAALRFYKLTLSPVFVLFGARCRHAPTCSEYAAEAVTLHGFWAGGWMALARFSRCRPFGTHGVDLVPEDLPVQARWYLPWRYGRWR